MRVDKLPRRDFLKTASLFAGTAVVAPEKTFAQESDEDVVLRFAVTSDTHFPGSFYPGFFPGNSQETQKSRLAKAIRLAVDYASAQPYDRLDAFAVCGDMTNRGVEEELVPFCETLDAALPSETRRVLCMGSHEYMGGSRELWEKVCKTPGNRRREIGGFQFITLSPDDTCETDGVFKNQLEWVERELEAAVAEGAKVFYINRSDNATLVSVDIETAQIIAMVGSVDWNKPGYGQVNAATSLLEPAS
ncbi:MAG: metallophosphoesterase, partial [Thermoguttaceae bacterium]|nr:metallophosphoesterase [Thermoguttaceae bacterium]